MTEEYLKNLSSDFKGIYFLSIFIDLQDANEWSSANDVFNAFWIELANKYN